MSLRFTVITAVRNRADSIAAAMESVHSQRWADIEHIVVDGASSDGTLDVLERYRDRVAHLISEPDRGMYDALNKGLRRATGDVVGFMHSDDEYASDESLAQVAAAFRDPKIGAVYGDLVYVSTANPQRVVRYWKAGPYDRARLGGGWMPPHPTFYVRREFYEQVGGFDLRYRIASDYDNMLRMLWVHNVKAAYVPHVLVRMRTGGMSNRSVFTMLQKSCEDFAALRQNQLGGIGTLLFKNAAKIPQFVLREPLSMPAARTRSI
jgi:glycosyltransferase involved in cell wall biosynthesis